ncbi:MAG TPA: hypothetical protein VMW95_08835 [Desulfobacterales bacterium]|nr:hypothetical protein [Desulfobacterales bacterium]
MGATFQLNPISVNFNVEKIRSYILGIPFHKEVSDKGNVFILTDRSFPDIEDENKLNNPIKYNDISNETHPANKLPHIELCNKYIHVGLNWSDTDSNDLKNFLSWALENFEFTGEDFEGYKYKNNSEIRGWIKSWLP